MTRFFHKEASFAGAASSREAPTTIACYLYELYRCKGNLLEEITIPSVNVPVSLGWLQLLTMSIARRATGSSRYSDFDDLPDIEPPVVPRLREYRVTPYSQRIERQRAALRASIYAVCFALGVAAGLGTARAFQPQQPAAQAGVAVAEQPVVTIRTLR
jgi:hypothetical protein